MGEESGPEGGVWRGRSDPAGKPLLLPEPSRQVGNFSSCPFLCFSIYKINMKVPIVGQPVAAWLVNNGNYVGDRRREGKMKILLN